jgi:glycosyltransferase involved in cell wall biosynthesis
VPPPLPAAPASRPATLVTAAAAAAPAPAAPPLPLVSLVVPMFREQENVRYLLRTLDGLTARLADRHRFELVLVDDGSDDQTWEALQRACGGRPGVQLLRHPQNRGVAAAIMTGIRAASAEVVCSLDCDCSYDPLDLEHMLPLLGANDLVTASPYHPDGQVLNVPRWRLLLSRGLSRLYRRLLRAPVHTWTSCFRVYRRDRVAGLTLDNPGFLGIAELLLRLLRRGGRVVEYPTLLEARLLGVSKMRTMRTIRGHLGLLWRVWRRRLG